MKEIPVVYCSPECQYWIEGWPHFTSVSDYWSLKPLKGEIGCIGIKGRSKINEQGLFERRINVLFRIVLDTEDK